MSTRRIREGARRHALVALIAVALVAGAARPLTAQDAAAPPSQHDAPRTSEADVAPVGRPATRAPVPAPRGGDPPATTAEVAVDPYDQLIDGGVSEFASGHWAEARLLFERAHLLRPSARTLRALGMTAFNLHRYAHAVSELEEAMRAVDLPLDAAMREHAEALVSRALPLVGRFTVVHTPEDATLSADGETLVHDPSGRLLLDIGRHTLALRAPAFAPARLVLDVHGGEDAALALHALPLTPAATVAALPARRRLLSRRGVLALTLGSVGLASGAAGLATWLGANRRFDDIGAGCRSQGGCFADAVDLGGVRRLERTAYGLAGVGATLLLTGALFGALERLRKPARAEPAR